MLRKHPPVDLVLSCLSCFWKPSVGVCQVVSNSPDPGIVWPSTRFPPDLWRWFEEDTASIRQLIDSGYTAKQREVTGLDNRGKWFTVRFISPSVRRIVKCDPVFHRQLTRPSSANIDIAERYNSECHELLTTPFWTLNPSWYLMSGRLTRTSTTGVHETTSRRTRISQRTAYHTDNTYNSSSSSSSSSSLSTYVIVLLLLRPSQAI